MVASGTATVEAASLGMPLVIVYKVAPLTYWVGRAVVRVPYLGMINLLAEREIAPGVPARCGAARAHCRGNAASARRRQRDADSAVGRFGLGWCRSSAVGTRRRRRQRRYWGCLRSAKAKPDACVHRIPRSQVALGNALVCEAGLRLKCVLVRSGKAAQLLRRASPSIAWERGKCSSGNTTSDAITLQSASR